MQKNTKNGTVRVVIGYDVKVDRRIIVWGSISPDNIRMVCKKFKSSIAFGEALEKIRNKMRKWLIPGSKPWPELKIEKKARRFLYLTKKREYHLSKLANIQVEIEQLTSQKTNC